MKIINHIGINNNVSSNDKQQKQEYAKIKRVLSQCCIRNYAARSITNKKFTSQTKTLLIENPDYRDLHGNNIPQILLKNGYFDFAFLDELFNNGHDINNINYAGHSTLALIKLSDDIITKIEWLLEQGCKYMICVKDTAGNWIHDKYANTIFILNAYSRPISNFIKHHNQYQEFLDTGDILYDETELDINYPKGYNKNHKRPCAYFNGKKVLLKTKKPTKEEKDKKHENEKKMAKKIEKSKNDAIAEYMNKYAQPPDFNKLLSLFKRLIDEEMILDDLTQHSEFKYANPIILGLLPKYIEQIETICKLNWDFENMDLSELINDITKISIKEYGMKIINFRHNEKHLKECIDYIMNKTKNHKKFIFKMAVLFNMITIASNISIYSYTSNNTGLYNKHNINVYRNLSVYYENYLELDK